MSSNPGEATVPASVTIPAGQSLATFTVATINNGVAGNLQPVQVSASAAGLNTGISTLGITDVSLPDLVVSSVTGPASGYDNAPLSISWTATNSGQYPASGTWRPATTGRGRSGR